MPTLAEIDAEIARRQPNQGVSLAAIDAELAKRQEGSAEQPEEGFFDGISSDLAARNKAIEETSASFRRGDIGSIQGAAQTFGQVGLGVGDVVGRGVSEVAGAVVDMTPESVKDIVSNTAETVLNIIPFKEEATSAINNGLETYKQWKDENPNAAKTFESSLGLTVFASGLAVTKIKSPLKVKLEQQLLEASPQPQLANQIKQIGQDTKTALINAPDPATQASILQNASTKALSLRGEVGKKQGENLQKRLVQISDDINAGDVSAIDKLDELADEVAKANTDKKLATVMLSESGQVGSDRLAKEAIKQGFDKGVISAVKGASPIDKDKMIQMVGIMQKGKENALFAMKNRPSDVAGNSLLERVNYIKGVNREAGKQVDLAAKSLRGKTVNSEEPIGNFLESLSEMGIRLDKRMRPNFKGSDVEGLSAPQSAIANITKRLASGKLGDTPDAFELHRMKKFIDEVVTYGKQGEGLAGKTERILKKLRSDLDSTLDANFPIYNAANTSYSDTVRALDTLQDVAGRKMDLFGPNADKATGTLLRRMMSNAQSRVNLIDAVDELESVSKKYGGTFSDDISTQMLFADELDTVFGPVAKTSLAGETAKGFKKGAEAAAGQKTLVGTAIDIGAASAEKLRGINEAGAFKSINELLKR